MKTFYKKELKTVMAIFALAFGLLLTNTVQAQTTFINESVTECDTYTWAVTGNTYGLGQGGTYTHTIGTAPKGTSGRNTNKQVAEVLNSSGIYAVVRHPLYLGNYLIWIGTTCFVFNIAFIVLISLLFWLYYERIMFAEERFLEKKFGNEYLKWSNKIPAFVPTIFRFKKSKILFSVKTVLRREYSGVLATVLAFCFVEGIRNLKLREELLPINMIYILAITIFISLFLRFLKRYTKVLYEENRS